MAENIDDDENVKENVDDLNYHSILSNNSPGFAQQEIIVQNGNLRTYLFGQNNLRGNNEELMAKYLETFVEVDVQANEFQMISDGIVLYKTVCHILGIRVDPQVLNLSVNDRI